MGLYAPVAPVQILREMLAVDPHFFGHYHLLLAHETVKKPGEFYSVFSDAVFGTGLPRGVVIMDNSVVETGEAVDLGMVREAANIIQAATGRHDWTVLPCLPDVMGDGPATRTAIAEAYPEWDKEMTSKEFMAIAQGDDLQDFFQTVNFLFLDEPNRFPKIRWLGIPRILTKQVGSRKAAIDYVSMVAPQIRIHLFGFSDNMVDDFQCARDPRVVGIDSAVPIRVRQPLLPTTYVPARDPEWFDKGSVFPYLPILEDNLRNVREWVGGTGFYSKAAGSY